MTAQFILRKDTQNDRIRDNIAATIARLPGSRSWEVTIKEHHRKRSDRQNAYLFGVVYKTIADATGYSADEIHELLGRKFLPAGEVRIGRDTMMRRKSTAKLSTIEFADYVDQIIAWAASEAGVVIPSPEFGVAA